MFSKQVAKMAKQAKVLARKKFCQDKLRLRCALPSDAVKGVEANNHFAQWG